MDTYSALRHFADSWALAALALAFCAAVLWAFRPGGSRSQADAMTVPFRHDDRPAPHPEDPR